MKNIILKIKTPFIHLCFWIIFGYSINYYNFPILNLIIFIVGCIIGTYTFGYVLMPRFFNRQYLGLFIVSCLLITALLAWVSGRLIHSRNAINIYGLSYSAFFFIAIAAMAIRNSYHNSLKIKNLQRLQTETELKFLKAQVNPQFVPI